MPTNEGTCGSLEQGLSSLHPGIWLGQCLGGGGRVSLPFQQALCGAGIAGVVQHWLTQRALHCICGPFWVTAGKAYSQLDMNYALL